VPIGIWQGYDIALEVQSELGRNKTTTTGGDEAK
jgi:hypothetical protein